MLVWQNLGSFDEASRVSTGAHRSIASAFGHMEPGFYTEKRKF